MQATDLARKIYLLTTFPDIDPLPGCKLFYVNKLIDSAAMYATTEHSDAGHALLCTKRTALELDMFALEWMIHIAKNSGTGMVYADHYQVTEGRQSSVFIIGYRFGSFCDDFNFDSVLLSKASALKETVKGMKTSYDFAGLYDLHLKLSQKYPLVHINEYLYSEIKNDTRKSGEKVFNYVDPKSRER